MADPPPYPGAPRWLKRSAIAAGAVALLLVILVHGAGGLHRHMAPIGSPTHDAAPESAH